jgi:homogentisate 1,2-dioxygenase
MTQQAADVDGSSTTSDITTAQAVAYQSGLGNEFETEALPGTLPLGQNSPQKVAHGLVSELMSGTTFGAPRALNRRSYLFRIRPSVQHGRFEQAASTNFLTPPFTLPAAPLDYCWGPFKTSEASVDFVDGLVTICGAGSPLSQSGVAFHAYSATASMRDKVFGNADGEMLIIPHIGGLHVVTEYGILDIYVGEIAVIPRGIRFRVELLDGYAGGFVCENFGMPLRLPELGLIGSNGLANVADFKIPVAAYEDHDGPVQWTQKFGGNLWNCQMDHSPLDVVGWRGSLYPYKYDLHRFVGMGTSTVDHPDPSIFCLLTSPSDPILGPNFDIMAITPRWVVGDHTFLAPGFHRNCVTEFLMLLQGQFGDLEPGSTTLTNAFTPHGPDARTQGALRETSPAPVKLDDQLMLLFETRFPVQVTHCARSMMPFVEDYASQWDAIPKRFGT